MEEENHTFPLLSSEEILAITKEAGIPLTAKNLANPTPDVTSSVYEGFVQLLMGFQRQEVNLAVGDALPHQELYKQAVPTLKYYKALSKLMTACGIADFSLQDDLYAAPNSRRFRTHLSALINFAKFREEKLEGYSRLTHQTDELLAKKQDLEESLATGHQRLATLREHQQQQEPVILKLTTETSAMEKEVMELNVKQATLKEDIANLKASNSETVSQIESHKTQIGNVESDIVVIKSSIVENPEQMKREIGELTETMEHEKRHIAKLDVESEQLARKVKVIGDIERDVRDCVELMRECGDEERRLKEGERQAKEAKTALERTELQVQQADARREQLDVQLRNATEKINRATKAGKQKEKEALREVEKAQQERAKLEQDALQNENKLSESAKQLDRMQAKLLQLQESQAADVAKLRDCYAVLEAQLRTYQSELCGAMAQRNL